MQMMASGPRSITWQAPEHHHTEKGGDWFLALGILTVAIAVAALFFGNILFALLVAVAGAALSLAAGREPRVVPFAVTLRGIRIDDTLYPYSTLESYHIDEDDPIGPQLLVMSQHTFMPLLVMPIPEEYIDDIDEMLGERLAEEYLEEPLIIKVLEFFGF